MLKDTGQEGLLEARFRLARFNIDIAEQPFSAAGARLSRRVLDHSGAGGSRCRSARRRRLGLDFQRLGGRPDVAHHAAPAPRLGVWVPWADTDSIGWVRYSLDQRHIPYVYVRDEDIRAASCSKYDVLLYGHVDLELAEQIQGIPKEWGPMPFKKTK